MPKNPLSCKARTIPYCANYYGPNLENCYKCFIGFKKSSDDLTCTYKGDNFYCQALAPSLDCYSCFSFYVPIQGVCTPCNAGPGCYQCDPTNLASCLYCITGFYLQNGMCLPCQPYCSSCVNGFSCESLQPISGEMAAVFTNNRYALVFNPSSCLTFNPTTLFCTSCQMGFYLSAMGACTQCL